MYILYIAIALLASSLTFSTLAIVFESQLNCFAEGRQNKGLQHWITCWDAQN